MKDRQSTYPNRIVLTPVPGQAHTYDWARADQPTEEGTLLNKANLLSDDTAVLAGLDPAIATPTPVFNKIFTMIKNGEISGGGSAGGSGSVNATSTTITLYSSYWSNKSQTLSINGLTPETQGMLGLSDTLTDEMYKAILKAKLNFTISNGSITFTCEGIVPNINIDIELVIFNTSVSE